MISFSLLIETTYGDLGRMGYVARHPFLNAGIDLVSTIGGAVAGRQYAINNKIDPYTGVAFGLVNGSNIGQLGGELIDRGLRNLEGDPYKGKRQIGDAVRDFAIGSTVGNATTGAMRSHDLPLAGIGGFAAGELAKNIYYGATEPSEQRKKRK